MFFVKSGGLDGGEDLCGLVDLFGFNEAIHQLGTEIVVGVIPGFVGGTNFECFGKEGDALFVVVIFQLVLGAEVEDEGIGGGKNAFGWVFGKFMVGVYKGDFLMPWFSRPQGLIVIFHFGTGDDGRDKATLSGLETRVFPEEVLPSEISEKVDVHPSVFLEKV